MTLHGLLKYLQMPVPCLSLQTNGNILAELMVYAWMHCKDIKDKDVGMSSCSHDSVHRRLALLTLPAPMFDINYQHGIFLSDGRYS